jgi:hypothetical protein
MKKTDLEILKEKFIKIRDSDTPHPTVQEKKKHTGNAGNTLEVLLGIPENNKQEADFGDWEVKSKRGKFALTLFSQKPSSSFDDNYMLDKYGIPDDDYPHLKKFNTSLYANRWSLVYKQHKMKIEVNDIAKKVFFIRADLNENITDKNVYWTFEDIEKYANKLKNILLVNVLEEEINGKKHFHYTDAIFYSGYKGSQAFIDLLKEGKIRYENRMSVDGPDSKTPGKQHNHGGAFRFTRKKDLEKLYNIQETIPKKR